MEIFWSGRQSYGAFWYPTCLFLTLIIFTFLLNRFKEKQVKVILIICGILAVIESNLIQEEGFFYRPGIPWNADVCLISLLYVGIGFYYKEKIQELMNSNKKYSDILAFVAFGAIVMFYMLNFKYEIIQFKIDMKIVCYPELLLAILLPTAFGIIFIRMIHYLRKVKFIREVLCDIGKASLVIMFIHIPINNILGTTSSIYEYVLVGVSIPLSFYYILEKSKTLGKIFGI